MKKNLILEEKIQSVSNSKIYRLWKHIKIDRIWIDSDTSILDDIKDSWFERRTILQKNSQEYETFLTRLKREHAIETGIVERMYDLSKGITETFIKEGFVKSYLSHGDTNINEDDLINHLNDHLDSVDFVFDVVKNNRPLTTGFIKELHHLVTNHQNFAEGRDQFGNRTKIPLIKGKYKERENNPTREDGVKILYCPPDHVSSEMDNLVNIHNELNIHPLISASWIHHAFTTIHPFQDGNGRVARLLASLIFIQNGYFPFTVLREEAKVKYINALENADNNKPQQLIDYFAQVQKRNIEKALNLKEVTSKSLEEVQQILVEKLENLKSTSRKEREIIIEDSRNNAFKFCDYILTELTQRLERNLNNNAQVLLKSQYFTKKNEDSTTNSFFKNIIDYSKENSYYFNRSLPQAWFAIEIKLDSQKNYRIGITIHHYGFDDSTIAIGAFLELNSSQFLHTRIPIKNTPHVISIINNNIESKKKNIKNYLEQTLTTIIAQIASEI